MKKLLVLLFNLSIVAGLMAQYTVTFNVDISNATGFNPDSTDVYISADFAGWPMPGTDPGLIMTVTADPNVYTYSRMFLDGENVIEYKYFFVYNNNPTWDHGEWDGFPNRYAAFHGASVLDNTWANQPKYVRFLVDMGGVVFDPDTTDIYISGTFADWAQPGTLDYWKMEDQILDMFMIERWIYGGEQQYKYFMVNHGIPSWDHGEWEGDPNRIVNIANDTIIVDTWGIITAVYDIPSDRHIDVFPNPCLSSININLHETGPGINSIAIHNAEGELVKQIESTESRIITIDTDLFSSGVYFIVVYTDEGTRKEKFIKK